MNTTDIGVTHRFVDLPGLRMHVAEAGQGEPIILAHGFPQNWWGWQSIIPTLAKNFHVIAPDLRGSGQTSSPLEGYDRQTLTNDILNLADALGLDTFSYVGHDWSALLGQQLCLDYPDRINKFVSLAIPPLGIKSTIKMFPPMIKHGWFEFLMPIPVLTPYLLRSGNQPLARYLLNMSPLDSSAFTAEEVERYIAPLREPDRAKAAVLLYRNFIIPEGMGITKGAYRETPLTTRSLFVMGKQDDVMPPSVITDYDGYLRNGRLEFVDSAGHFILDHQPERVTRLVNDFLLE